MSHDSTEGPKQENRKTEEERNVQKSNEINK